VTYENGRLVRAVTRGDGEMGDDVTANVLATTTLPKMLRGTAPTGSAQGIPAVLEVRGEIYLGLAEFARINQARRKAGEPPFSHPRNLAAGTLQQLDASTAAARKLTMVFYGYGDCQPAALRPVSQQNWLQQLRAWGLPTVENPRVVHGADALWAAVQAVGRERGNYPFPTDGAVVKLDESLLQKQMGVTHQAPRWALAYKFTPERAQTKLLAITLQVGRTGVLTPVGELQPVQLGGSTVRRASLYNRDEIARRDIRVGDYVYVEKAGEIIPAISGVNRSRRTAGVSVYLFPVSCPSCQGQLQQSPEQAAVRCLNRDCPAQVRRRLEHFASRAGVNITGLGPALIDQLVSTGRVKTAADLYRLRREDFPAGNGKTAERVLRAIAQSKQAELWRFINGLGIPGVGEVGARALARQSGGLAALARVFHDAETAAAWEKKVDLGEGSFQAVQEYFSEPSHQALLIDLVALGVRPNNSPEVGGADQLLQGKRFVLTGALQRLTRAQATALIMAAGGVVEAKVSRRTDYLIVGEGGGAKLAEAAAFGVAMIDEAQLQQLLRPGADGQ
jgi:DNA ligase (NAD+)